MEGLSRILEFANGFKEARLLTSSFEFGYLTGQQEADDYHKRLAGNDRQMGCVLIIPHLLEAASAQGTMTPERCDELRAVKNADAGFEGPQFARGRLKIVKNSVSLSASLSKATVTSFEEGYAYGFKNVHDRRYTRIRSMAEEFRYGCAWAIEHEAKTSPAFSKSIRSTWPQCETLANTYIQIYLEQQPPRRAADPAP